MTFRVGQEVVCVAPPIVEPYYPNEVGPLVGHIYTIRAFHPDGDAIVVDEIINPYNIYFDEVGGKEFQEPYWLLKRFRPVVKTETNISIFTSMLSPSPSPIKIKEKV